MENSGRGEVTVEMQFNSIVIIAIWHFEKILYSKMNSKHD